MDGGTKHSWKRGIEWAEEGRWPWEGEVSWQNQDTETAWRWRAKKGQWERRSQAWQCRKHRIG